MIHYFQFRMGGSCSGGGCPVLKGTTFSTTEHSDIILDLDIEGGTEPYTIIIEGEDKQFFKVEEGSNIIKGIRKFDYEYPLDANKDNVYKLDILVLDSEGKGSKETVTLTITDDEIDNVVIDNPNNLETFVKINFNRPIKESYAVYEYEKDGSYIVNNSPDVLATSEGIVDLKSYRTFLNNTDSPKTLTIGKYPYVNIDENVTPTIKNLLALGTAHFETETPIKVYFKGGKEFWGANTNPITLGAGAELGTDHYIWNTYPNNGDRIDPDMETFIFGMGEDPDKFIYILADEGDIYFESQDYPFDVYQGDDLIDEDVWDTTLYQDDTEYKIVFKEEEFEDEDDEDIDDE